MKKIILLIFLAIFFQSCFFLNGLRVSSDVGVIGGGGISNVSGGDSWESKLGLQFGVETGIFNLGTGSGIHSGLGVSFQGANWSESYGSGEVNLAYLNVPILYNHQFDGGFYGEIGLQPGFLLSAKDKYDGMSVDYNDYVKGFELGLPVGAGYNINKMVSVGVRGTFGLTNFDDSEGDESARNQLISATVKIRPNWFKK